MMTFSLATCKSFDLILEVKRDYFMRPIFNFSAGPAMMPEEVLRQAQAEMLDWQGTGMSIIELGHRGPEFQSVLEKAEVDLRELLAIPENYEVLFIAGGASTQFAMVPLNLLSETQQAADYVETGMWSRKAVVEAKRYGEIQVAAQVQVNNGMHSVPLLSTWKLNPKAAYVHYTPNETVDGVEFHWVPETGEVPLVADMTSSILAKPIDVKQYGLIYAGAQKNMGMAGITVVIIRKDLVREPLARTPTLCAYQTYVEHKSCYNTPPTYPIYFAGLVFAELKRKGGVKYIAEVNQRKCAKLYACIDKYPDFYRNHVEPASRAVMNVPFSFVDQSLTDEFLREATGRGLTNLRGHRAVGGCRASIYNAMPEEGVDALVRFMEEFAGRY